MPPLQVLPSPSSGSHVPSPSLPLTLPLFFFCHKIVDWTMSDNAWTISLHAKKVFCTILSKCMWTAHQQKPSPEKNGKNQEKTYFYRLFLQLRFLYDFYDFWNSLKNIKKTIKGVFRAILLLQRERLKEMWSNKVAKTKKKHTSIDFFHLQFFMIFDKTSNIVSKT